MLQRFVGETWYAVDLLVDYPTQRISVYIDGKYKATDAFFT